VSLWKAFKNHLKSWVEWELPLEAAAAAVARRSEAQRRDVLVAVSNPETVEGLISLGLNLSRPNESTVALKVVPVAQDTPLSTAQRHALASRRFRDILQLAARYGDRLGATVETILQATHDVAAGIVDAAAKRPATRLLLLGWHGPLKSSRFGTNICREIIRLAPCDVAVFLNRGLKQEVQNILIPVSGGQHARLGLRLAADMVACNNSRLEVLLVLEPGAGVDVAAEISRVEKLVQEELGDRAPCTVIARTSQCSSVEEGILDEARRGDQGECELIILGASEKGSLRSWLFGSIPDAVAAHAPCSVLLVHKHEQATFSWIQRLMRPNR